MTSQVKNQNHRRFRNDDGSLTTATWIDSTDVDVTLAGYRKFRLRICVQIIDKTVNWGPRLRYQVNGSGGYSAVGTASSGNYCYIAESDNTSWTISDGDTFTPDLGSGGGSGIYDTGNDTGSFGGTLSTEDEMEWTIDLNVSGTQLSDGDYIEFRVYDGNSALDGYGSATARMDWQAVKSFTVPAASLAFDEQTPALQQTFNYYPAAATLALTEATPSSVHARPFNPAAASLAFTEATPERATGKLYLIAPYESQATAIPAWAIPNQMIPADTNPGGLELTGATPTFSIAAGSGDVSFTVPAGSLAYSEQTPTYLRAFLPVPAAGTLTLSPATPASTHARLPVPAAGSLAFTEGTPTATVAAPSVTMSPAAGSLAFAEGTPTAVKAHLPVPAAASLTLSVSTPQLTQTFNYYPAAASLALSVATPTAAQFIGTQTPAAASLTLTGGNVTLDAGGNLSFTVPAGSAAFSTATPTSVHAREFIPAAGSLTLTESTPTVTWARTFVPAAGSLAFDEQTPTVTLSSTYVPAAGSLAFDEQTPSAVHAHLPVPAAASLAFSVGTPTTLITVEKVPAAGGLTLSAATPTMSQEFRYYPAAASATLSTGTPTLTSELNFTPAAASVSLSMATPTLQQNWRMYPAAGSATFSTATPTTTRFDNYYPTAVILDFVASTPTRTERISTVTNIGRFWIEEDEEQRGEWEEEEELTELPVNF